MRCSYNKQATLLLYSAVLYFAFGSGTGKVKSLRFSTHFLVLPKRDGESIDLSLARSNKECTVSRISSQELLGFGSSSPLIIPFFSFVGAWLWNCSVQDDAETLDKKNGICSKQLMSEKPNDYWTS